VEEFYGATRHDRSFTSSRVCPREMRERPWQQEHQGRWKGFGFVRRAHRAGQADFKALRLTGTQEPRDTGYRRLEVELQCKGFYRLQTAAYRVREPGQKRQRARLPKVLGRLGRDRRLPLPPLDGIGLDGLSSVE